jgi:hypothetical protein
MILCNDIKVEYYFLRSSAEKFAADLRNFVSEVNNFSDEQLVGIVAYHDHIRENIEKAKKELERRTMSL